MSDMDPTTMASCDADFFVDDASALTLAAHESELTLMSTSTTIDPVNEAVDHAYDYSALPVPGAEMGQQTSMVPFASAPTPTDNGPEPEKKKRGRPRNSIKKASSATLNEKRREQVRLAQRAYRSRLQATLSSNDTQIAQLQMSLKHMNASISSFGRLLEQSTILHGNPLLQQELHNTLEQCQLLAAEDVSNGEDSRDSVVAYRPSPKISTTVKPNNPYSLGSPSGGRVSHMLLSPNAFVDLNGFSISPGPSTPGFFDIAGVSVVDLKAFIYQLRRACSYRGLSMLRNAGFDEIKRPFRFLLSLLTREKLTSYFEAVVAAGIYPARLDAWSEIPFLSLGGSGTHYPVTSSISTPWMYEDSSEKWFDARDLEGFLLERNVHFVAKKAMPRHPPRGRMTVDPSSLIDLLVSRGICLGRSPGWRLQDVETALRLAQCV